MRNLLILIALGIAFCAGCKVKKPAAANQPSGNTAERETSGTDFSEQSTWILGYFNPERLTFPPYSEWYEKGFDDYRPDQDVIARLSALNTDDITITVVMGTWCPDSRREVPRFMKVLSLWKFPLGKVTFIGVDNEKKSPLGDYEKLDIVRVPTFIIYNNKVEAGRIVENPVASLEQDMLNILNGNEKK
ncbi:MAG: thioredoxin family protein [Bacteroidales bacterium]